MTPVITHQTMLAELLGIFAAMFLGGFWFLPGGVLALRRLARGETQVDLRPAYGSDTLYRVLDIYGPAGIRMFRNMLLADMIFPAVYGTLFFLIGGIAAAAHPEAARAAGVVSVMGVTAAGFDYLENIFLLVVLSRLPSRLTWVARAAGMFTSLKLLCFVTTLSALAKALLGS